MEHIVQFGISIDDDRIKKSIEANVMNHVTSEIKKDVMKSIVGKKCSNYEYTTRLNEIVVATTEQFLRDNKDAVIEETAKKLAERLTKTKAVKDMVNSTINSLLE